jgi:hypothetical protein
MEIGEVTPFYSGETMNFDQMDKGINIWCSGKLFPVSTHRSIIY